MTDLIIEQENQDEYKHKVEMFQAMAELEAKEKKLKLSQGYAKAYLFSVLIPPIGIYYFVKYVFFGGGERENTKAGIISLVLTLASFFLSFWLMTALFKQSTSGTSQENYQILKDLTVPNNQKKLLDIYK
jgi:hypothetical protein